MMELAQRCSDNGGSTVVYSCFKILICVSKLLLCLPLSFSDRTAKEVENGNVSDHHTVR